MTLLVPDQPTKTAALRQLREKGYKFSGLLSDPESNLKVSKNITQGVLTSPLHLAPARLSGYEVCPKRTDGCTAACLHTAGNPVHQKAKDASRIAKTKAYMKDRPLFMSLLIHEIASLKLKAGLLDMTCGVRLNATSDIPWERVSFAYKEQSYPNIMTLFPTVKFYDYTKRFRAPKYIPSNYHITFSLAEDNDFDAYMAMATGMNVAVVMNVGRTKPLPKTFKLYGATFPVHDGDTHDFRPSDPKGHIIGLRAKGDARGDTSGFVRDVSVTRLTTTEHLDTA